MKIALLCGGPSLERGISLNSARSVLDHLESESIKIIPVYFDHRKQPFLISKAQLYSNTPSDFDFKLKKHATQLSKNALVRTLKSADITFPVIHGAFGEDGQIQAFLEKHKIPYVGSDSKACKKAFDKYRANEFIRSLGFYAPPSIVLKIFQKDHKKLVEDFFAKYELKRAIVKPASGGSSIGVYSVASSAEALKKKDILFSKRIDTRVVVEPFCTGAEFTVIILQNKFGLPVAILPTEIETDYSEHQIFDYRKKYLPSRQVRYHCPPRFATEIIEKIQAQAEQLFVALGMRDFARFDGWVLKNKNIWFSDFNPVSGMEQNSFLFQQSSRIGLSHSGVLQFILKRTCERQNIKIEFPKSDIQKGKKNVNVLSGGQTSERQVSLMTGTNVWLKLRNSKKYYPKPFLLDVTGNVWELPYALTLNHTVEEIMEHCVNFKRDEEKLRFFETQAKSKLALDENEYVETLCAPKKMTLSDFLKKSEFVFIGLHGGFGENGEIQKLLAKHKIKFNGPDEWTSSLCMNKWLTAEYIKNLRIPGVSVIPQKKISLRNLVNLNASNLKKLWRSACRGLGSRTLIIKPISEGCSSGIIRLTSHEELAKYITLAKKNIHSIPKDTFKKHPSIIEMPLQKIEEFVLEKFIGTDSIRVVKDKLKITEKNGWIEITVGVIGCGKNLQSLNPSLTVAQGAVLSVEEKFQGGTGINITPPYEIAKRETIEKAKGKIQKVAAALKIRGYSRIDAFMHVKTGDIIVIEVNTLPALTPSTVLFHQALTETPPIYPKDLLEKIIEYGEY